MTTDQTTGEARITIKMSEQAPVNIDHKTWRIIARAERHDGAVRMQANTIWYVRVCEHDDGRRIVYGVREEGNGGQPVGWRGAYAGYLIDTVRSNEHARIIGRVADATIRAIRRVAGIIGDAKLGAECIADLPAQEL